jgi:hypothetical protein
MAEPPSHEVAEPRQAKTLWRSLRQRLRRDRPPPGQERPVHEVVAAVAQESLEAARAPGAGDSPVPEPSERAPRATPGKDEP